jgi:hypothetical protein
MTDREIYSLPVPPPWLKFMEFCKSIGHGEIDKLKIQDGVPVLAEKVVQKTKFA